MIDIDPDKLREEVDSLIEEAGKISEDLDPNAMVVDDMDNRLTSLMSNANDLFRYHEARANFWKSKAQVIQEKVRSLRRIHETLNSERRMGG